MFNLPLLTLSLLCFGATAEVRFRRHIQGIDNGLVQAENPTSAQFNDAVATQEVVKVRGNAADIGQAVTEAAPAIQPPDEAVEANIEEVPATLSPLDRALSAAKARRDEALAKIAEAQARAKAAAEDARIRAQTALAKAQADVSAAVAKAQADAKANGARIQADVAAAKIRADADIAAVQARARADVIAANARANLDADHAILAANLARANARATLLMVG